MRALVLDAGVRFEHNYPHPGHPTTLASEALVRVLKAGICNTDLELVKGYANFKGVLGHEFVGIVEACPADPNWIGQRVVGEINVNCGSCERCLGGHTSHCPSRTVIGIRGRDGAFADYMTLPIKNLYRVPDTVRDDHAVFVEPLAAALEIAEQIHLRPSDQVVIVGDGKLGQLIARVLVLTGCALAVVGHHARKLELLAPLGVDTLQIQESSDAPEKTANVVIEATGSPAGFSTAQRIALPRGRIVLKSTIEGLTPTDLTQLAVDEVQLIGSRCGPFPPALRLLARGLVDVEPLIQARYTLDHGLEALEHARTKGNLKVLIDM